MKNLTASITAIVMASGLSFALPATAQSSQNDAANQATQLLNQAARLSGNTQTSNELYNASRTLNSINQLQNSGSVGDVLNQAARLTGNGSNSDIYKATRAINSLSQLQNGGSVGDVLNQAARLSGNGSNSDIYKATRAINSLSHLQNGGSIGDVLGGLAGSAGINTGSRNVNDALGALNIASSLFGSSKSSTRNRETAQGTGNIGGLLTGIGASNAGPKKFKRKSIEKYVAQSSGLRKDQFTIDSLDRSSQGTSYKINVRSGTSLTCFLSPSAQSVADSHCTQ